MLNISTPKLIFFNKKKPTSSSVFNSDQLEKENTLQAFLVGKTDQMQMWKVSMQNELRLVTFASVPCRCMRQK